MNCDLKICKYEFGEPWHPYSTVANETEDPEEEEGPAAVCVCECVSHQYCRKISATSILNIQNLYMYINILIFLTALEKCTQNLWGLVIHEFKNSQNLGQTLKLFHSEFWAIITLKIIQKLTAGTHSIFKLK